MSNAAPKRTPAATLKVVAVVLLPILILIGFAATAARTLTPSSPAVTVVVSR